MSFLGVKAATPRPKQYSESLNVIFPIVALIQNTRSPFLLILSGAVVYFFGLNNLSLNNQDYDILVNDYEPAGYCGVIISKPDSLIIEMAKEPNLERLCHGEIVPWSAELSYTHHTPLMIYKNVESKDIRNIMYEVVKSISRIEPIYLPELHPAQGYYEFVITDKLKFIDYHK